MKKKTCVLILSILICSCNVDLEEGKVDETLSEKVPNVILENVTQYSMKKGRLQYQLNSERSETFNAKDKSVIYKLKFKQFDKDGKVISSGVADRVEMNVNNRDAAMFGNINVRSEKEKTNIMSEYVFWKNEEKILTGKDDIPVIVQKDDGTRLEGKGFYSKMDTKSISFNAGVKGVFVSEKSSSKKTGKPSEIGPEKTPEKKEGIKDEKTAETKK